MSRLGLCLFLAVPLSLYGCDDGDGGTDGGDSDAGEMTDAGAGDAGSPAETCSDGIMNQDETDEDCGGTCGMTCIVGEMCGDDGDCVSDICDGGVCEPMPTCMDGVTNGTETDIDCGGGACEACDSGLMCSADDDCTSEYCSGGTCTDPVCGNGMVEGGTEDCDPGTGGTPMETDMCDTDCTDAMCGDGIVNMTAGEACDGNGAGLGGQTASCDADCTAALCGDGVTNPAAGEDCDDGSGGTAAESATCDIDCTPVMCGDMVVNVAAGEQCDDGNTDDTDRCSNSCTVNGPSVNLTANATFDTDTGELDGVLSTGWVAAQATLYVQDFTLATGVILTVTGSNPFIVQSSGDVDIAGTILAAGEDGSGGVACNGDGAPGGVGGPGGGAGGDGGGIMLLTTDGTAGSGTGGGGAGLLDNGGGGGGGHLTDGTDGTVGTGGTGRGTLGAGGAEYTGLATFEGGSGGGGGSVDDDTPTGMIDTGDDGGGGGGGGGGSVVFESTTNITVTGSVDASGGDGGDDGCDAAAGGGGSGGTIIFWAPGTVEVSAATFDVTGGVGGASSTTGGDGGDGADGEISTGARPTCTDGVANGDETDVDCGGTVCGGCGLSSACNSDADCMMGSCVMEFCVATTCTNAMMDGMETDVDCGGPDCGPCADALMCSADTDCLGTGCETGVCVSCADGTQNDMETDVDCGGTECSGCGDGDACLAGTDCTSGACESNLCVSCSDGALNQDETDVDCGGATCTGCGDGDACLAGTDCTSGSCESNLCVSCSDGALNQDETDVDCGGTTCAARCVAGQSCTSAADCAAGVACTAGACESNAEACGDAVVLTTGVNTVAWSAAVNDYLTGGVSCTSTSPDGPDLVFSYTATADEAVTFTFDKPTSQRWAAVASTAACGTVVEDACVSEFTASTMSLSNVVLTSGQTVYVYLVDTTSGSAPLDNPVTVTVSSTAITCSPGVGGVVGTTTSRVSGGSSTTEYFVVPDSSPTGYVYYGGNTELYRLPKAGGAEEDIEAAAGLTSSHLGYRMLIDGLDIYTVDNAFSGTNGRVFRISRDGGATWAIEDYVTFPTDPGNDFRGATIYMGRMYLVTDASSSSTTEIWSAPLGAAGPVMATLEITVPGEASCNGLDRDATNYYLACSSGERVVRIPVGGGTTTLITDIWDLSATVNNVYGSDLDADGTFDALYVQSYYEEVYYTCDPAGAAPFSAILVDVGGSSGSYGMGYDATSNTLWMYDDDTDEVIRIQ